MLFLNPHKLRKRWQAVQRVRLGRKGENLACRFLRRQGYFVWKRNWRCRYGELDIIAYNDSQLRLIEVKTRSGKSAISFPAIGAVDKEKTRRIEKLAHSFLLRQRKAMRLRRLTSFAIDAITVHIPEGFLSRPVITHVQNIGDGFSFSVPQRDPARFCNFV